MADSVLAYEVGALAMAGYWDYWGKARPLIGGPSWHPLPCHCLDVVAVGRAYLDRSPRLLRFWADRFGWAEQMLLDVISFFLALHDLGKFAHSFQAQNPDVLRRLQARDPHPRKGNYTERHDSLGAWLWTEILSEVAERESWLGDLTTAGRLGWSYWVSAVTGHHGLPPKSGVDGRSAFLQDDLLAAREWVDEARGRWLKETTVASLKAVSPVAFEHTSRDFSWWLAGLTVLADWLGSNTDWFGYCNDARDPDHYWNLHAQEKAKEALRDSGVLAPPARGAQAFEDLFPKLRSRASPLQQWAATQPLSASPQLVLLEDVTGAGKTEAAFTLAARLMAQGAADGLFIGLPTMATANAMYGRLAEVYPRFFEGEASAVLAHANKGLMPDFTRSIARSGEPERDARQADLTATARCAAWLADHNKRALLAPTGVGTVDQALLGVLHSRHQSLRLLGLVGKVLVIDEVHACDPYMQRLLEELLRFHARAGGSAILLSATLPIAMKASLLDAFAQGCGLSSAPALKKRHFPLASHWIAGQPDVLESPLETRPEVCRRLHLRSHHAPEQVYERLHVAVQTGQCACWIRNTIADAMAAYTALRTLLPEADIRLFHARYALADRIAHENALRATFGPASAAEQRHGRVLIATQVVEQSLDLDFDVLISDLAPIDRLIQRAGRLRRHVRDAMGNPLSPPAHDGRGDAVLEVLTPEWSEAPPADWFKAFLPKAARVYPHHAQLWRTARVLQMGALQMPEDAREAIEAVFDDREEAPEALLRNAVDADGERYFQISAAQMNVLKFSTGYQRGGSRWDDEAVTPSRLGEASVQVLLARWDGQRLRPWHEGDQAWDYSSLRVPARLIGAENLSPAQQAARDAQVRELPAKAAWAVVLALVEDDMGNWTGTAISKPQKGDQKTTTWHYDAAFGLRLVEEKSRGRKHESAR